MTKFFPVKPNSTLTSYRENYKYEIMNIETNLTAFTNRKPRKDSKFADDSSDFVVWDLKANERVIY